MGNKKEEYKPTDVEGLRVQGNSIKEFFQYVKNQFILHNGEIKAQKVFDRVHKKNPRLSKPFGYIQFDMQGFLNSASIDLATAMGLATRKAGSYEAKKKVLESIFDGYAQLVLERAKVLSENIIKVMSEKEF